MNTKVQEIVFAATSRLTEITPVVGARLLNATFLGIGGSQAFAAMLERRNRNVMKTVKGFRRFLVISDIHLGDAVLAQSTLMAIRDCFPEAEIDFVINRVVAPVIEGNPDATRVVPLFANSQFPSATEIGALRELIHTGHYDLVFMLCPFIRHSDVASPSQALIGLLSHSATILRNESHPAHINHFSYQEYLFVRKVLSLAVTPVRSDSFQGISTRYSDEVIEQAASFYRQVGATPASPVIMFNPDSASKYNMMPFVNQAALLERLVTDSVAGTVVLLGEGHTAAGIGTRLLGALPPSLRTKIRIIPQGMSLEVYSALIDFADIFVTGDTGPMHLAASRKHSRSGSYHFRNHTAIVSLFGATPPRMSGYDSFQPGFLDSNQDAPSWCYQAESRCRNITCLNKMLKTCKVVRCFEHVDVTGMAELVTSYVNERFRNGPAVRERRVSLASEPLPTA